jgi:pyruvate/2-oxoglutarate dehydrogenase complex dihydrolipoamide acyltransferase (E2) component
VRGNAALSLVRYGDGAGRQQIVALLQSATITAPIGGRVVDADKAGTVIHQGGLIAKLQGDQGTVDVRSPIGGRIRTLFAQTGGSVKAGAELATVDPAVDQVWEGLRALYLVGQTDDLAAITPFERELPEIPDHIRQQAALTDKAIRDRGTAAQ